MYTSSSRPSHPTMYGNIDGIKYCRCDYGFVRDSGRNSGCVRDPNHDMAPEGPAAPLDCPPGTLYNLSKVP